MTDPEATAADWSPILPPDLGDIERLARAAIDALPEAYRDAARAIALRVEEFASDDILDDLDLTDPFELSGLYEGTPLTEKSVMDQPDRPDTIWLFRRADPGRMDRPQRGDAGRDGGACAGARTGSSLRLER